MKEIYRMLVAGNAGQSKTRYSDSDLGSSSRKKSVSLLKMLEEFKISVCTQ